VAQETSKVVALAAARLSLARKRQVNQTQLLYHQTMTRELEIERTIIENKLTKVEDAYAKAIKDQKEQEASS
jgi:hypothetical protein